jgi:hypothetical protein
LLCRVHENDLGAFEGGDCNSAFACECDAVTLSDVLIIHQDPSSGGHEIAVSRRRQGIFKALSGLNGCAEYPGICIDLQRILVFGKSARKWHEASSALRLDKGFGCPAGIDAAPTGQ